MAVSLSIPVAALGLLAASARADGDPASDVLVSQTLFLPQDAGVPANQQAQLDALLHAAQQSGYQIRVALIASPTDLGSVTELWRQPQNYARFLAQELSLLYRGPLLVVMPNGYGLYRLAGPLALIGTALHDLKDPQFKLSGPAIFFWALLAAAWPLGRAFHQRERAVEALSEQADVLHRERDEKARAAVAAELATLWAGAGDPVAPVRTAVIGLSSSLATRSASTPATSWR